MISDDVVQKQFVCDLAKCKGGCCEEGDAGAPLDEDELEIILEMYEKVKPYLTPASIAEVERKGKYVYNREFGWVTPTLGNDNEICVYGHRDKTGLIKCAFEEAYYDGVIPWKKPISCHLFPVNPACALGKKLEVPTYEFLKEPLTRKYGEDFYNALDKVAKLQAAKKNLQP